MIQKLTKGVTCIHAPFGGITHTNVRKQTGSCQSKAGWQPTLKQLHKLVISKTVFALIYREHCRTRLESESYNNNHRFTAIIQSTCISQHLQLRTGGFCRCKVLLSACPCRRKNSISALRIRHWSSPQQCYPH